MSYVPREIHNYPDVYVARVWNSYRVSRLIAQSIIIRLTSYQHENQEPCDTDMVKLGHKLVSDVCASVPFLLGYELGELKRQRLATCQQEMSLWPQNSRSDSHERPQHLGSFSLIWPLHLSSSVSATPENQRRWIRAQLKYIAEHGQLQAKLVCENQSRTLLGQAEDFRFDFV